MNQETANRMQPQNEQQKWDRPLLQLPPRSNADRERPVLEWWTSANETRITTVL